MINRGLVWALVLFVSFLAFTACMKGKAGAPKAAGLAMPRAVSIKDSLSAEAKGQPVVLHLDTNRRLVASSVDGSWTRVIADGPFEWGMVEPALDLVWVKKERQLQVMDLRASKATPRAIAEIPLDVSVSISWNVGGRSGLTERPSFCEPVAHLTLEWGDVIAFEGYYDREAKTGARLIDKGWLKAQRGRRVNKLSRPWWQRPSHRVTLPKEIECEDADCGAAVPFGASGKLLVLTGFDLGEDCRHFACQILAPDGRLGPPPGATTDEEVLSLPAGSCGPFDFEDSGKHYLAGSKVCSIDGHCRGLGGPAIGWLTGGSLVGPP